MTGFRMKLMDDGLNSKDKIATVSIEIPDVQQIFHLDYSVTGILNDKPQFFWFLIAQKFLQPNQEVEFNNNYVMLMKQIQCAGDVGM